MKQTRVLFAATAIIIWFTSCERAPRVARILASDGSQADVQAKVDSAVDGDTITLPSGTFSWTKHVQVNKGVTIKGNTTTNVANGQCNDLTKLVDNINRATGGGEGFFHSTLAPEAAFRISGITFTGEGGITSTAYNGVIRLGTSSGVTHKVRFDHLHFTGRLAHNCHINFGQGIFGVVDHVVMDQGNGQNGQQRAYNGTGNGDLEWSKPVEWGGPDFIFFEDCWLDNRGNAFSTAFGVDSMKGGKYVVRYCELFDIELLNHGTDSGVRSRAGRGYEIYNNHYHWDFKNAGMDGVRGGTQIVHDNTFDGVQPGGGFNNQTFRVANAFGTPFGGANGANPWDSNDPKLYESGTATAVVFNKGKDQTLTDSSKNWTPNQWVGYSVGKPGQVSGGPQIYCQSNTSNSITGKEFGYSAAAFVVGDKYEIRKVLVALDQPTRGAGDLVTGDPPINTVTNSVSYPRQVRDPAYSWNNIHTPTGAHINFGILINPPLVAGVDYFNDTPKPGYTPYTYPHPLVGGTPAPTPPPSPTSTPAPSPTATPIPPTPLPTASPSPTPTATITAQPTPTAPPQTPTPQPTVTASPPPTVTPPAQFVAWSSTEKSKGYRYVYLGWSGSSAAGFDVYRNAKKIAAVYGANDYTDELGKGGSETFLYKICEQGTQTCTANTQASF